MVADCYSLSTLPETYPYLYISPCFSNLPSLLDEQSWKTSHGLKLEDYSSLFDEYITAIAIIFQFKPALIYLTIIHSCLGQLAPHRTRRTERNSKIRRSFGVYHPGHAVKCCTHLFTDRRSTYIYISFLSIPFRSERMADLRRP